MMYDTANRDPNCEDPWDKGRAQPVRSCLLLSAATCGAHCRTRPGTASCALRFMAPSLYLEDEHLPDVPCNPDCSFHV